MTTKAAAKKAAPKKKAPAKKAAAPKLRTTIVNQTIEYHGDSLAEQLDEAAAHLAAGATVIVSKQAPWKTESDGSKRDLPQGAVIAPERDVDSFRHGDMVSVRIDDRWEQLLVAADNPEINKDKCWLVVADDNDWTQVGTFKHEDYLREKNARRIFRHADRAEQAKPTIKERSTPPPSRSSVLFEAEGLITGDRNKSYGSPVENFDNTAAIWTIQIKHLLKDGVRLEAPHVAQLMMGLKLARLVASPKRDNYVDIAGYAGCGWECEEANINAAKAKEPSARRQALIPQEWANQAAVRRAERENRLARR